jgi:hypothetical protein
MSLGAHLRKILFIACTLALALPTSGTAAAATAQTVAWQEYQRPSVNGVVQPARIQQVAAPGPAAGRPTTPVMRVELRPGDVTNINYRGTHRAEVYGRAPASMWSTPAAQWPDPVGSVRWYSFALYVPADYAFTTDPYSWEVITQWKGLRGGSPPISLEIKRDWLRLGGARTNAALIPNDGNLGRITRGAWTRITIGLSLSPILGTGWVEVWRDGRLALARTAVATMDTIDGAPDPVYFKQGIYRNDNWPATHVLYFGPTRVGMTRAAVA